MRRPGGKGKVPPASFRIVAHVDRKPFQQRRFPAAILANEEGDVRMELHRPQVLEGWDIEGIPITFAAHRGTNEEGNLSIGKGWRVIVHASSYPLAFNLIS